MKFTVPRGSVYQCCGNCKHWKGHQEIDAPGVQIIVDDSECKGCNAVFAATPSNYNAPCFFGKWEPL